MRYASSDACQNGLRGSLDIESSRLAVGGELVALLSHTGLALSGRACHSMLGDAMAVTVCTDVLIIFRDHNSLA